MDIVTGEQMAAMEAEAIREGSSPAAFMEEAGSSIASYVENFWRKEKLQGKIYLLCGKGNNGGDGYVAGCHLKNKGFAIEAYQLFPLESASPLCRYHASRFLEFGGIIHETEPSAFSSGLIVDAIFGTGFTGRVPENIGMIIDLANTSALPILSVDISSGLNSNTGSAEKAITAKETLFLGLPKLGFFLAEGWEHTGELQGFDFGLPKKYIEKNISNYSLITLEQLKKLLPKVARQRDKYSTGTVFAIGGMMAGAVILSSSAALRAGAGLVTLAHPENSNLWQLPAEIIHFSYEKGEYKKIFEKMNSFSSILIGPGLGKDEEGGRLLSSFFENLQKPAIIDADAITLVSRHKTYDFLPKNLIFTPHLGELARLLHREKIEKIDQALLEQCQEFVERYECTLVVKGAPTFILHKEKKVAVSIFGDPGMATAGSGDVLTGIMAASVAQKLANFDAAQFAVALHGLAGEAAAFDLTPYYMNASDITSHLPHALKKLQE